MAANRVTEKRQTFLVSGVCCSTEESVLRKSLDRSINRDVYIFNSVTCELHVDARVDSQTVLRQVRQAGFDARLKQELLGGQGFWERHRDAVFAGTAVVLTVAGMLLGGNDSPSLLSRGFLLTAIVTGGWKIFLKAVKAARQRALDMNVLMSLAVIGALLIGKWAEGAAVIVLFSISLMLESYSTARTRRAVESMLSLSPEEARVVSNSTESTVPAKEVEVGTLVQIRPGERVPLDGIVDSGHSAVNEAPITGESSQVAKGPGDQVFAGSINELGSLAVRVTRRFEETTLSRIMHLIDEAHQKRAPVQLSVDRFARVYTPVVLGIAAAVALIPPMVLAEPFESWLYRGLVLLVIACPCALVIATPVSVVSALTTAARRGVLIKGGTHLEVLSRVNTVAFDKTGTLTEGKPHITDVVSFDTVPLDELIRLVAAIESMSEHHLASAVLREAERKGIDFRSVSIEAFQAIPGRGVRARVSGRTYYLGNQELSEEHGFATPEVRSHAEKFSRDGKTVLIFGMEGNALGLLAARDATRARSKSVIDRLHQMGIPNTVMLSGDRLTSTKRAAAELAVRGHRGELLPEEKVVVVEELKRVHGTVAMVGDGINDAPALAAASVGIGMGVAGSDAALETADVVLMSDDLTKLPFLFSLSRRAMTTVKANIILAVSLKVIFLFLSVFGYATLWMAVLADDGAALVVILNGLRLLSYTGDQ